MNGSSQEREYIKSDGQSTPRFDDYGRCIPASLMAPAHKESRRYFSIVQPKIDYSKIYERLNGYFNFSDQLLLEDFKCRAKAILDALRNDDYSNICNGVGVPFILPKAEYDDIGKALENYYLMAVQQSFNTSFPKYSFVNHCKESIAGKLGIAKGSRHENLIEAMQHDVVVGFYFPCLLEYSVPAAIEQMAKLPNKFLLAGGFDTAAAFIGSPELLLRTDGYPPLLWFSGLSAETENVGYHFEAYGYNLTFNRRVHFGHVAEYWASALVVMG